MADSDFQPGPPQGPAPGEGGRRQPPREGEGDIQREPAPAPRPRAPLRHPDEDDDEPRIRRRDDPVETLIPYRNPRGLIAYYLGVFSLVPCLGLALGPAALILGIMGLRYSKKYPTAKGGGHAIAGIVLGLITSLANWGLVLFGLAGAGWAALH